MYFFREIKEKIFLILIIGIILIGSIIRIIAFNNNIFYIPLDDCHSLADFENMTFKQCFTTFLQGANFLPLYKALLLLIYKLFGFNFLLLKLPSLIASILVLPAAYSVLKKLFNNRLIIITALTILAFNYNLIYFAARLKPYIFDVLFALVILNSVLSLPKEISLKNILKYSAASIPIMFFSIPSIVLTELYWFITYIKNIIIKNTSSIKNLLIFQLITIITVISEYFLYIKQINNDTGLKSQWTADLFYYAPKSLAAVNTLIQFIYFKFFWWDTSDIPLFHKYTLLTALFLFLAGIMVCIINSVKNKNIKDIFLISPVLVFLLFSYLHIYPFCNRPITFLIPFIIFITFKAFDFKTNKTVMNTFIIIYLLLFAKYTYHAGEIQNLIFNDFFTKKHRQ